MGLIAAARAWWLRQRPRFRRLLAKVNRRVPPGLRLLLGVVLMAGGVLGFLPVLGFWMLPLGLILLAIDLPLLRPGVGALIVRGRAALRRWRQG